MLFRSRGYILNSCFLCIIIDFLYQKPLLLGNKLNFDGIWGEAAFLMHHNFGLYNLLFAIDLKMRPTRPKKGPTVPGARPNVRLKIVSNDRTRGSR
jgi:hypothetical protein